MNANSQTIDLIPLHMIGLDPLNARNGDAPVSNAEVADLAASMTEIGQIYPIVVRRAEAGAGYLVSIGKRRYAAAMALGWDVIQAVEWDGETATLEAMSAAENMARAAMPPVDEWRAVHRLVEGRGWSVAHAANALGIDPLRVPRMTYLARMSPRVLDAMRAHTPDRIYELRTIAAATHDAQDAALEACGPTVDWWRVAQALVVRRIPQASALFDVSLMSWDEDLFAEPDGRERFTTSDVETFLVHQRAAAALLAADPKRHIEAVVELRGMQTIEHAVPKGKRLIWDAEPKRWRKDDPRSVLIALFVDGPRCGVAERRMLEPTTAAAAVADAPDATQADAPKLLITKTAQRLIAEKKHDGVVAAMNERGLGAAGLLRVLLLALAADNVNAGRYATRKAIVATLIDDDGTPKQEVTLDQLRGVVRHAIDDIVVFRAPDVVNASGAAAEWIALALEAEMPRCDTPEILKGVALAELKRLAREASIADAGTATQLRARLAGALPDWRPAEYGPMRHHLSGALGDDAQGEEGEEGEVPDAGAAEAAE